MKILLLAPHPLYQDRGSPIAVKKILKVLSERQDWVDVVTYHEGKDIDYDHVTLHRTPNLPFIHGIRPGFSWKKVVCDFFMLLKTIQLVSKERYQLVHAVEESVFIAWLLKVLLRVPYVYDMDSSLVQQMIEQHPSLIRIYSLLSFFEGLAVGNALAIVPVCHEMAADIMRYEPRRVVVLGDISLLEDSQSKHQDNLRAQLGIGGPVLMYVGNLEVYQGIDLLLESFALVQKGTNRAHLVIIGGEDAGIQKYQEKTRRIGIHPLVHFVGPRPVEHLASYLSQADILVSPRIKGKNTPMKIFSYLDSGKPILATDLRTHTQVLDDQVALLAEPYPEKFAKGMLQLMEDGGLRARLGKAGKKLVEEEHSYALYRKKLDGLLDRLAKEVSQGSRAVPDAMEYSPEELY